ncbi:hypothetical protein CHUAL_009605 [Chamberlinius hualienensis]
MRGLLGDATEEINSKKVLKELTGWLIMKVLKFGFDFLTLVGTDLLCEDLKNGTGSQGGNISGVDPGSYLGLLLGIFHANDEFWYTVYTNEKMKTYRWIYHKIFWATLLLICCCGNVADDHQSGIITDKEPQNADNSSLEADEVNETVVNESPVPKEEDTLGANPTDVISEVEDVEVKENLSVGEKVKPDAAASDKSLTNELHFFNSSNQSDETLLIAEEPFLALDSIRLVSTKVNNSLLSDEIISLPASNTSQPEKGSASSGATTSLEADVSSPGSNLGADGPGVVTPLAEDIPSFNEWAKQRLEEQGKNGQHTTSGTSQTAKVVSKQKLRQKNYASTDCGAKVLIANPEAQGTSAVLGHYSDDYMLNPCDAKIWLIIELCESIQVERIEVANFELFSSSPKEFSVYSSDRYPTREWKILGNFVAKDERVLQNFSLNHNTFGKFLKLEVLSHYGSEHYCPLSRLRVYGTSEYEALDTEEEQSEETVYGKKFDSSTEDDELLDTLQPSSQEPPNLFGSAKDAVINIVKKAAQALRSDHSEINSVAVGNRTEKPVSLVSDETKISTNSCMCFHRFSQSECDLSSEVLDDITKLLECEYYILKRYLSESWRSVTKRYFHMACARTCLPFLNPNTTVEWAVQLAKNAQTYESQLCKYVWAFLGEFRFGAVCRLDKMQFDEKRGVPTAKTSCPFSNVSTTPILKPSLDILTGGTNKKGTNVVVDSMEFSSHSGNAHSGQITTSLVESVERSDEIKTVKVDEKIEPTKTLSSGAEPVLVEVSLESPDKSVTTESESQLISTSLPVAADLLPVDQLSSELMSEIREAERLLVEEYDQQGGCSVSPFVSESPAVTVEKLSVTVQPESVSGKQIGFSEEAGTPVPPVHPQQMTGFGAQKESLFVRLTNRIKALELNMSLSSQYLEELSRRYKKQMEEMQKSFNKTILALNDTAKLAHERDLKQQEMIIQLRSQLNNLSDIVSSLLEQQSGFFSSHLILRHILLMLIETVIVLTVVFVCLKSRFTLEKRQQTGNIKEIVDVLSPKPTPLEPKTKKKQNRSLSLANLSTASGRIEELSQLKSAELISNHVWEVQSTSSCSSVHTEKSWQEVENPKKRKKKSRLTHNNNNDGENCVKSGLYKSLSNNVLCNQAKPPVGPSTSNSKHANRSKNEFGNSSAGLLFDSTWENNTNRAAGLVARENRLNFKSKYDIELENLNRNKFARLPHYEAPLCRPRLSIIDGANNFKKTANVVWG